MSTKEFLCNIQRHLYSSSFYCSAQKKTLKLSSLLKCKDYFCSFPLHFTSFFYCNTKTIIFCFLLLSFCKTRTLLFHFFTTIYLDNFIIFTFLHFCSFFVIFVPFFCYNTKLIHFCSFFITNWFSHNDHKLGFEPAPLPSSSESIKYLQ